MCNSSLVLRKTNTTNRQRVSFDQCSPFFFVPLAFQKLCRSHLQFAFTQLEPYAGRRRLSRQTTTVKTSAVEANARAQSSRIVKCRTDIESRAQTGFQRMSRFRNPGSRRTVLSVPTPDCRRRTCNGPLDFSRTIRALWFESEDQQYFVLALHFNSLSAG